MAKHSGGTRTGRPVSAASVGSFINTTVDDLNLRVSWNSLTNKNILAAESSIRINDYETAFVFDKNGELLDMATGGQSSVEIETKRNTIVTHNHPRDTSLSQQDIITAAQSDLLEIRAVGKRHTYSVVRPKGGWGNIDVIKNAFKMAGKEEFDRGMKYIRNATKSQQERTARNQTFLNTLSHFTLKNVARQLGWEYRKETLK